MKLTPATLLANLTSSCIETVGKFTTIGEGSSFPKTKRGKMKRRKRVSARFMFQNEKGLYHGRDLFLRNF